MSFLSFADGEYMFVDPESKLSKYGPKSWRSSHTHVSSHHFSVENLTRFNEFISHRASTQMENLS